MLQVTFYRNRSALWPLAEFLARQAHRCEQLTLGRLHGFECVFSLAQKNLAWELLQLVRNWKGCRVVLGHMILEPTHWGMAECFLRSPDDEGALAEYCSGAGECCAPCKRAVRSVPGEHPMSLYARWINRCAFRVDREALARDVRQAEREYGLEACLHYGASSMAGWIGELPEVMEVEARQAQPRHGSEQ